jgi:hypothetical protein
MQFNLFEYIKNTETDYTNDSASIDTEDSSPNKELSYNRKVIFNTLYNEYNKNYLIETIFGNISAKEAEDQLILYDFDYIYGPRVGFTRLERYEHYAITLGLTEHQPYIPYLLKKFPKLNKKFTFFNT